MRAALLELERLHNHVAAVDTGALGYVARASGVGHDARVAHPFHDLGDSLTVPTYTTGDVLARFLVRADEARIAATLLCELLPNVSTHTTAPALLDRAGSGVGIIEGWRGTIVHRVELDRAGTLTRLKVVDPSFLTWPALPLALADTIVPDFPLANKSFNLSYAGNDL